MENWAIERQEPTKSHLFEELHMYMLVESSKDDTYSSELADQMPKHGIAFLKL